MGKFRALSIYLILGLVLSIVLGTVVGDSVVELMLRIIIVELLEFIVWSFVYGDK